MRKIADTYTITATLGAQFEFDGVTSFVVKAIPTGGSEEETIVLPYERCWNEVALASNHSMPWRVNPYMKPLFKWGPLNLPVPKGSFFDAPEGWAIDLANKRLFATVISSIASLKISASYGLS